MGRRGGRYLTSLKLLSKRKEFKLKVVSQMGGGAVSGKDGLSYPFVRVIHFHKYTSV